MSIELNANSPVSSNTETTLAVKSANLVKSQTEEEGKKPMNVIATASVDNISVPTGNSGQNINTKA